jgi:5-methylcytosine-specific restriction endonuclease McrA
MSNLPTHHTPIRRNAADNETTLTAVPVERGAAAASKAEPETPKCDASQAARIAIVVSTLAVMGVRFSFKPGGAVSESPTRNDEAQSDLPQAVRRRQYDAHIGSSVWKNGTARQSELVASGFRCRICNRGREEVRLEVHHRTYRNFGCELMSDLTTLCADCHVGNTDMLRRRRYAVHLPVSADVPATERGAPLFDPMAPGESS